MQHQCTYRVRYADTDQMGYLYHGNYATLYEVGRTEMLRGLGLTYKGMEARGTMMPVVSLNQRFVRPAHYDEVLTITTTLRELPGRYITFHVEIHDENNKLVNGGTIKLTFFNPTTEATEPCPGYLLEKLQPYFETETT